MLSDIDDLITLSLAAGEIESGLPLSVVQNRCGPAASLFGASAHQLTRSATWSASELEFLRSNYCSLTDEEIGAQLGRSAIAVHLKRERDLHLPSPSKHPDFITANRTGILLGIDAHKVVRWVDDGVLEGHLMPCERNIRIIRKVTLLRWAVNPMNWIWFDPDRVVDPHLHRLLELKKSRWGDEWWTTPQVAAYHGVEVNDVKRFIAHGKIRGVQAPNRGGRNNGSWANWFILRSEATRADLVFPRGRGSRQKTTWSDAQDHFILRQRQAGASIREIAIKMKQNPKRIDYRYRTLQRAELDKIE